jgi:hypothetical protein
MDSSVSPKDEIRFLRVCYYISTGLYHQSTLSKIPEEARPYLHGGRSLKQARINVASYSACCAALSGFSNRMTVCETKHIPCALLKICGDT